MILFKQTYRLETHVSCLGLYNISIQPWYLAISTNKGILIYNVQRSFIVYAQIRSPIASFQNISTNESLELLCLSEDSIIRLMDDVGDSTWTVIPDNKATLTIGNVKSIEFIKHQNRLFVFTHNGEVYIYQIVGNSSKLIGRWNNICFPKSKRVYSHLAYDIPTNSIIYDLPTKKYHQSLQSPRTERSERATDLSFFFGEKLSIESDWFVFVTQDGNLAFAASTSTDGVANRIFDIDHIILKVIYSKEDKVFLISQILFLFIIDINLFL